MCLAVAVGTVLLGSWVLAPPDQPVAEQESQPQSNVNQLEEPSSPGPVMPPGRSTRSHGERSTTGRTTGGADARRRARVKRPPSAKRPRPTWMTSCRLPKPCPRTNCPINHHSRRRR